MPNNENLSWLLTVNADTGGAEKLNKALKDSETGLGAVDVATSKTERAMESAGARAAKMGDEVAKSTKRYVSELMAAGVPMDRLERLAKVLHGTGEAEAEAGSKAAKMGEESAKAHEKGHEAAEGHAEGFRGVGHAVDEAKEHVHGFLEAIGAVLAFEVAKEGINLVRELGSEVLHTAANAERLEKSFELNIGTEDGRRALEYAEQFAKNTEFTGAMAKQLVGELSSAGVPAKDLDLFMAAAGDAAATSTNKVEGMQRAVAALSRAQMLGVIDVRDLRGLDIGVEKLRTLDEFAKKTDTELHAMMTTGGTITKDQVFRLIAAGGPETNNVGDLATQMSTTMGAQLDKLAELPERYIEKFRDSKGFDSLKERFASTIESLDPDSPTGSRVFGALEGVFNAVAAEVAGIDFAKLADEVTTEVIPAVKGMAATAASIDWVSGAKALVGTLEVGLRIVKGIGVAFDAVTGAVDTVLGVRDKDIDRVAVKAAAEKDIPSDIRRAVMKEQGELPETPENAARARGEYEQTRDRRLERTRIRHLTNQFDSSPDEAPSALEAFQERMADSMRRSEAAGPQLPKDRTSSPAGRAPAGADAMTPYFESAGRDAAAGYVRGLTSSGETIGEAGAEVARAALKGTAKAQESSSPSRKFARLGGDAVDGYVDALDDGAGDAARAGAGLSSAGLSGTDSVPSPDRQTAMGLGPFGSGAAAGFGAGGPVTITIPITISVGGGATGRGADEAVDRLRSSLPGALTSALEQLGIEAGV